MTLPIATNLFHAVFVLSMSDIGLTRILIYLYKILNLIKCVLCKQICEW